MVVKPSFLASLLLLSGCGGAPPDPTPPSPETVACTSYCDAASKVGCPKSGDCMEACLSTFEVGCKDLLERLLECAAASLTSECVPRRSDGKLDCASQLADYDNCVPLDVGVDETSCGPSVGKSETPASGCEGSLSCPGLTLSVQCDADESCTCVRNGETVGTCTNLLGSAYFCAPHAGCCTPFFYPN